MASATMPETPRLRPYAPDDAMALSALYRASVQGLGPAAYTPAQVAAWAALTPTPHALAAMAADGRARWVATLGGARAGFLDLEPDGHLALLYVAPQAARRGVGAALLRAALAQAGATGLATLHTEASALARPLFARFGFATLERRMVEVGGVAIHNHAMARRVEAVA